MYEVPVKSKVKISKNFVAFSEYMNFKRFLRAGPSLKEESPPLCMYGARYGKRQAQPLLRWGKRAQDPLRWGKRQALASFWAPFWRSKGQLVSK